MPVRIKVYGGTPVDNLCESCSNLREIRGHRVGDVIRNCQAINHQITFEVATCDYYQIKPANYPKTPAVHLRFDPKQDSLMCSSGSLFAKWYTVEEWRSAYRNGSDVAEIEVIGGN